VTDNIPKTLRDVVLSRIEYNDLLYITIIGCSTCFEKYEDQALDLEEGFQPKFCPWIWNRLRYLESLAFSWFYSAWPFYHLLELKETRDFPYTDWNNCLCSFKMILKDPKMKQRNLARNLNLNWANCIITKAGRIDVFHF